MNKTYLHQLIEKLPESTLPTVGSFIGYMLEQSSAEQISDETHDNAQLDDEDYSQEELESFQQGIEEFHRGETISHDEMKRRFNVA